MQPCDCSRPGPDRPPEPHVVLHPLLWAGDQLRPAVRDRLLRIVDSFLAEAQAPDSPRAVILTGSLANYNWTATSDIDLHLLYEFDAVCGPADREMLRAKAALWNIRHEVTIGPFEVELYVQDATEPHAASGQYAVRQDRWLVRPDPAHWQELDTELVAAKAAQWRCRIRHALAAGDSRLLDALWDKLKQVRRTALAESGETAVGNLVFKALRHDGTLARLADARRRAADRRLSLAQLTRPGVAIFVHDQRGEERVVRFRHTVGRAAWREAWAAFQRLHGDREGWRGVRVEWEATTA